MNIRVFWPVVVIFILLADRASAATLYVSASNAVPAPPFNTWSTAATNIQDAIDAATNGDTILVTNGVYRFGGKAMAGILTNRVAVNKPVTVQSVNGPWVTTIGGAGATNGLKAVRCAWLTNGAALVGFTLTAGATASDVSDNMYGGGVWCSSSSNAIVANCVIVSNTTSLYGGGAYQGTLLNCLIYFNSTTGGGGSGACNAILNNCTVISNANYAIYQTAPNLSRTTNCIVYFNGVINYGGSGIAFTACCTTPAAPGNGNFTNAPQLFVDNARLTSTSPCIGAGATVATGTDIFGNAWNNPPSVGCAEWQPAPVVTPPQLQLTKSPVGFMIGNLAVNGLTPFTCSWLKDGVPLTDNGHFTNTQSTNLTATGVTFADAGNYQLVVSNAFGVVTSSAAPLVIHCVDVAGTNPAAPYLTWATAATNIQDAIAVAAVNEVVLVNHGVYASGGIAMDGVITNRVSVNQAMLVQSVGGPGVTTIQGGWDSAITNGPGAVRCAWLTTNAILSGFTLFQGATRSVTTSPNSSMEGGGVFGLSTQATVDNCVLTTNYASYLGGGAYQVTLNRCLLTGNSAVGSGTPGTGISGAGSGGGAASCNLTNCVITANFAQQSSGGGVYYCNVRNCALLGNTCGTSGSGAYGGTLVNCTATGNRNTAGNYSQIGFAVMSATLTNCIVYGNVNVVSGATNFNYSSATFSDCDTDPLPAGTGNIDVDPQFIADGVHLAATSPCIGAGIASAVAGTDLDGQPWNNPPAMGCDEWQPTPVICAPPTYQVSVPTYRLTFNAIVAGQPPFAGYWSKDGVPIQDDAWHTNSGTVNLIVKNFRTADAGLYQLVVSNAFGMATSGVVAVTLAYPPVITVPPQSVMLSNGGSANFSVTVVGTGLFAYQWYFTNSAIVGGTNAVLPVIAAGVDQSGSYYCVITNDYGSVTSRVVTLGIGVPPSIIIQPTNQVGVAGSNAVLNVVVGGTGPFHYQWQLDGTNLPNNLITTIAGNGISAFSGDGGPATNANLSYPWFAAVDGSGNIFISDYGNSRVRRIDTNGIMTTAAGNGTYYYSGDGGAATNAGLTPTGVAADDYGNIFIADSYNYQQRIRQVNSGGVIMTVAGKGSAGYSGDGGAATNAMMNFPNGVAVDAAGSLFIADTYNNRVRQVNFGGIITSVAGKGPSYPSGGNYSGDNGAATNAGLNYPNGVAVDNSGNLYLAEYGNCRVRKVDTNGIITTVAGNGINAFAGDGGAATNASLSVPRDVKVDALGNLYIADYGNYRVRKVDPNGIITTVAGNGTNTFAGDGGPATNASLKQPTGVALDAAGNLFIVDCYNHRVREVSLAGTPSLALNQLSPANAGNYSVLVSGPFGSVTSSIVAVTVLVPPTIQIFSQNNGQFTLTWGAVSNQTYQVQCTTNLASPNWIDLGSPITTNGGSVSTTDAASADSQRFYRVVVHD